jgi:NitT/TauT family transport system substrate-binding protein
MLRIDVIAFCAAALVALGADAEPLKLRVQYPVAPGYVTPMIPLVPKEVQPHYGVSYTVEPVFIQGSSQALTAFAAGELEIAGFTPQALAFSVLEAKIDSRAIGQWLATDVPGYGKSSFWVHKAEIKKVEDLKGKIVAINGRGTTIGTAAVLMLHRHGLKEGQDYQLVEVRIDAGFTALQSKRVSLAYLIRPWDRQAMKDPSLAPLFGIGDVFGRSETGFMQVKPNFMMKNRAVLVDFLEDQMRMRRWAHDPKTRPEAVKILAQVMKQPESAFADWVFTNKDNSYRDPDLKINVEALQKNIDVLKEAGIIKGTVVANDYVDLSLAEEARKRVDGSR